MKKLTILLIFLSFSILSFGQRFVMSDGSVVMHGGQRIHNVTPAPSTLLTGIVAYYDCEEVSGGGVDRVGSNTGTNTGVVYGNAGVVGNGWTFDGGTDQMALAATGDLNLQEFSISLWFQTNYYYPFISNWASGQGWWFELNGGTKTRLQIGQSPYPYVDSDSDLRSTTVWHHAVATYDGATLKMYIDGTLQTMTTAFSDVISYTGVTPLIGRRDATSLVGQLDEIGVWNKALTQSEVTELYNSGNGLTYDNF